MPLPRQHLEPVEPARRERVLPVNLPEPILVLGAYGYRNLGDEAVLAGLLRELGPARVTVVSRSPAETEAIHGVRAIPISRAVAALRTHRTLLVGGGGLFGTGMGRLGQLIAPFATFAAAAGRTVVVEGVGVDAALPAASVSGLRLLAPRTADFSVRDSDSADALLRWGIESRVAADLSAGLEPSDAGTARALLQGAGLDPVRPILGLSLTELEPSLAGLLPGIVEALDRGLPGVQLAFIAMSRHPHVPAHNDALLAQRLQAHAPRMRILEPERSQDALALFGLFSAAVCMRYHSLHFAERAGIPIIALPYAQKCRTWIRAHEGDPQVRLPSPLRPEGVVQAAADAVLGTPVIRLLPPHPPRLEVVR